MLQVINLNYNIAGRQLLQEIDWIINSGRHIALVGPNGAGKTTLLRIINGELQPDTGDILKPADFQIGFLPQEEISLTMGPILEGVIKGHLRLTKLKHQIDEIHHQLSDDTSDHDPILEKLSELEDRFNRLGGYRLESDAKAILAGLGFSVSDYSRPLSDFSGGWRMRVYLSRLLLQSPDLLLLDEPTNHLDLESLAWLEGYLRSYKGSIITVSHDRFFIDRIADEIADLDFGKLTLYTGNYREFQQQKKENEELLRKRYEEQQEERARIQRFIDRFRYKDSKASQVQSRVKYMEKMDLITLPQAPKTFHFNIKVETHSYKAVLQIRDLWFKYNRDWVLQQVDLDLFRGEKVALVGVNGAGKTTLTRLIFGQLTPQKGAAVIGERVDMGYYAQHQVDSLNLDSTIFDEVAATAADTHRPQLRDILGIFQFSGSDPEKKIGVLSGGEKARVSLAKILLSPVNFLIMDEPTNHLDITSQSALEDALDAYDGTLLLISHDRYFLDRLVTRVIELKAGKLRIFEGKYSDYLERRYAASQHDEINMTDTDAADLTSGRRNKDQKRRQAEARQAVSKQRQDLQSRIDSWERQIHTLEAEKSDLEAFMSDPSNYSEGDKIARVQRRYGQIDGELMESLEQWEQLQLELEALLSRLDSDD